MRKPKELPEGALERLGTGLKQAKTKAEFQSVQCVWLRASLKLSAEQVATAALLEPTLYEADGQIKDEVYEYASFLQSKMYDLVGNKIYEHVKVLSDLGMVKAKPKKKSIELTTTKKFIETFGIDARSRQDVKAWLETELEKMTGKKKAGTRTLADLARELEWE